MSEPEAVPAQQLEPISENGSAAGPDRPEIERCACGSEQDPDDALRERCACGSEQDPDDALRCLRGHQWRGAPSIATKDGIYTPMGEPGPVPDDWRERFMRFLNAQASRYEHVLASMPTSRSSLELAREALALIKDMRALADEIRTDELDEHYVDQLRAFFRDMARSIVRHVSDPMERMRLAEDFRKAGRNGTAATQRAVSDFDDEVAQPADADAPEEDA